MTKGDYPTCPTCGQTLPGGQMPEPTELRVDEAAKLIGSGVGHIYGWIKRGELRARKVGGPRGQWLVDAHSLMELRARLRGFVKYRSPTQGE